MSGFSGRVEFDGFPSSKEEVILRVGSICYNAGPVGVFVFVVDDILVLFQSFYVGHEHSTSILLHQYLHANQFAF